jgi:hypothetical protein
VTVVLTAKALAGTRRRSAVSADAVGEVTRAVPDGKYTVACTRFVVATTVGAAIAGEFGAAPAVAAASAAPVAVAATKAHSARVLTPVADQRTIRCSRISFSQHDSVRASFWRSARKSRLRPPAGSDLSRPRR